MQDAFVELACPDCDKLWERDPNYLPEAEEPFDCPDCGARHATSEFARTTRDLEVMEAL